MKKLFFLICIFISPFIFSQNTGKVIYNSQPSNPILKKVLDGYEYVQLKNGESMVCYANLDNHLSNPIPYSRYKYNTITKPDFMSFTVDSVYVEKSYNSIIRLYYDDVYADLTLTASNSAQIGSYEMKINFDLDKSANWSWYDSYVLTIYITIAAPLQIPLKPQLINPANSQANLTSNISLKWNTSKDAEKYLMQLSKLENFGSIEKSDSTSDTVKTISGLLEGQKYYWRIQAKNSAGTSPWSDPWNFITSLSPPTNLTAARSALKEITLTWQDNSNNESGYVIERKQNQQPDFSKLDSLKTQALTFVDKTVEQGQTYYYRIKNYTKFAASNYSNTANLFIVGVNNDNLPPDFALMQNYPNPFNPTTKIKYSLPENSFVRLTILDVLGREVQALVSEEQSAGTHEIIYDASKTTSGIYLIKMIAGDFTSIRKILYLK